ncbi:MULTISPECIES: hypothetical protein [unclassified Streptomyces]|uniref:hypothetical protein n=1 Tax=unclassified Streptomyces TaxID=2593676 RepID=UPI002E1E1189
MEGTGSASPYRAEHYERWHGLLRGALGEIPGIADSGYTAHALLAVIRADLVEHLVDQERMSCEQVWAHLADFTARVLGTGASQG